jgi:hypothetical protein
MIFQSFPYSKECIVTSDGCTVPLEESFDPQPDWIITEAIEGSLIRVFCFNDKWFITTHRKLDAFKSKWGSELSFGEIFRSAVLRQSGEKEFSNFLSRLNKARQYTFLITSTDITKFVCKANEFPIAYLYAITENKNGKTTIVDSNDEEVKAWTDWKQKALDFTFEEAIDFVAKLSFPFKCQGLLLFNTKTFDSIKLINHKYKEYFDIRGGNIPSVPFAYLHIMSDKKKAAMFRQLISEKDLETVNKYDQIIEDLVIELHGLYMQRYVNKDFEMKTDQIKHRFLLDLHAGFQTSKMKVTKEVVRKLIYNSDPPNINRLIKEKIRLTRPLLGSEPIPARGKSGGGETETAKD